MGDDEILVDLLVESAKTRDSVENRIKRRSDLLREWLRDGVPADKTIPKSLRAAREWEDSDLYIKPIASPNEFTTTHAIHGSAVRDIAELLTALKKRFDRPSEASPKQLTSEVKKFDRKANDKQLQTVVSQWHAERDEKLKEKRRADSAEARSVVLLEENAEKDEQIADLQRRLVSYEGLRTIK